MPRGHHISKRTAELGEIERATTGIKGEKRTFSMRGSSGPGFSVEEDRDLMRGIFIQLCREMSSDGPTGPVLSSHPYMDLDSPLSTEWAVGAPGCRAPQPPPRQDQLPTGEGQFSLLLLRVQLAFPTGPWPAY